MIQNNYNKTTLGDIHDLKDLDNHIYTEEEIKDFSFINAVNSHPLSHKPSSMRSKLAYKEIMSNLNPTSKYILPGTIVLFGYSNPKYASTLDYYDGTPLTLFFGITRTDNGKIREIGFNLHYFPPYARLRMLQSALNAFSPFFEKQFNEDIHKPNHMISYKHLKYIMRSNLKLAFGVREYIPTLRGQTYVIPTRLLSTAFYSEGHFSSATLSQIFKFWRQFRRF